jgi:hypothetical protein
MAEESTRRDANGVPYTTPGIGPAPTNTPVKIFESGVAKPGQLNSDGTVSKTTK